MNVTIRRQGAPLIFIPEYRSLLHLRCLRFPRWSIRQLFWLEDHFGSWWIRLLRLCDLSPGFRSLQGGCVQYHRWCSPRLVCCSLVDCAGYNHDLVSPRRVQGSLLRMVLGYLQYGCCYWQSGEFISMKFMPLKFTDSNIPSDSLGPKHPRYCKQNRHRWDLHCFHHFDGCWCCSCFLPFWRPRCYP